MTKSELIKQELEIRLERYQRKLVEDKSEKNDNEVLELEREIEELELRLGDEVDDVKISEIEAILEAKKRKLNHLHQENKKAEAARIEAARALKIKEIEQAQQDQKISYWQAKGMVVGLEVQKDQDETLEERLKKARDSPHHPVHGQADLQEAVNDSELGFKFGQHDEEQLLSPKSPQTGPSKGILAAARDRVDEARGVKLKMNAAKQAELAALFPVQKTAMEKKVAKDKSKAGRKITTGKNSNKGKAKGKKKK